MELLNIVTYQVLVLQASKLGVLEATEEKEQGKGQCTIQAQIPLLSQENCMDANHKLHHHQIQFQSYKTR